MGGMPALVTLSGQQWKRLQQALAFAFPSYGRLQNLMKWEIEIPLEMIASSSNNLDEVTFNIVEEMQASNRIPELLDAAMRARPGVEEFILLAQELRAFPTIYDYDQDRQPRPLNNSALQAILAGGNTVFNVQQFTERIVAIQGQVCLVEIDGTEKGTGFLVGPSAVMTNYHVVESLIKARADQPEAGKRITLRFDYKVMADGRTINSGEVRELHDDWLIDHSPYSASDKQMEPRTSVPTVDELDYAILRTAGAPANEQLSKMPSVQAADGDEPLPLRNFIALPSTGSTADNVNKALFIFQHPNGRPMKVTINTLAGANSNGTRVTYLNDTEGGSSGSPCFNGNLDIVALHHAAEPGNFPTFNQGIPIDMIGKRLKQTGALEKIAQPS